MRLVLALIAVAVAITFILYQFSDVAVSIAEAFSGI